MRFNNIFPYFAVSSVFIIMLLIQIFLGIFVYKDSKKRGMEPVLWTLIVIFVPNFIGLIIYLVVRSTYKINNVELRCKSCGKSIQSDWKICPHCMSKLDIGTPTIKRENAQYNQNSRQTTASKYKSSTNYNTNSRSKYSDFYEDGKKDNNTLIVIIIVVILVLVIGLFVTNFISIPRFLNFDTNISIMNRESESSHHIKKSFSYWDGVDDKEIKIKESGTLVVKYDIECKEGSIYTALKDIDNKLIKTFPQNGKGSFEREVQKGEIFYLTYRGEEAKGSLSFEFNVN